MNIDLNKTQAQIDWLKQKLYLDAVSPRAARRIVKRGQVYSCDLGVGVGSELQKKRPCVIVQNDVGNLNSKVTIIVPISHTERELDCIVPVTPKQRGETTILDGFVNVSGIRSIDKARIDDYICDLTSEEMKKVDKAIARNIDIFGYYVRLKNMYEDKLTYIDKMNEILDEVKDLLGVEDNKKIAEELKKVLDKSQK